MPQTVVVRAVKTRILAASRTSSPRPPCNAQGDGMARDWPLWNFFELGAYPEAVPCARLHVRHVLWEWRLHGFADTTELLVSELVTNSVNASQGLTGGRYEGRWRAGRPPVRVWLQTDRRRVLISVWDGNNQMPQRKQAGSNDEHGRGLLLVEQLSDKWGAYTPSSESGKVTWALMSAPREGQDNE